eukprot:TRINITY_DN9687_c0_g1_i1.p1 TRINITY_DN9687_c0_g1~~TRINITY_DN9687_c0_g1_i1.p1  ORF type:complete len:112 (-),score=38.37 TRINITY_DN9687_c0_g1_i1:131-445(-)
MSKHTIVLTQFAGINTRKWNDFDSVSAAMDDICHSYENKLRQMNPQISHITYDVKDLYAYIDDLADLSCLIFNPSNASYDPKNKEWIKGRVLIHLKEIAAGKRN